MICYWLLNHSGIKYKPPFRDQLVEQLDNMTDRKSPSFPEGSISVTGSMEGSPALRYNQFLGAKAHNLFEQGHLNLTKIIVVAGEQGQIGGIPFSAANGIVNTCGIKYFQNSLQLVGVVFHFPGVKAEKIIRVPPVQGYPEAVVPQFLPEFLLQPIQGFQIVFCSDRHLVTRFQLLLNHLLQKAGVLFPVIKMAPDSPD
ncbi:MAG: hypothetical protein BWY80_01248 [Firmicutes bacterium ADurb.Bin456]|nr:MAG: hypothetical protein BWY80_01248 [Firmicutes bacterium ADurb.Bin456]